MLISYYRLLMGFYPKAWIPYDINHDELMKLLCVQVVNGVWRTSEKHSGEGNDNNDEDLMMMMTMLIWEEELMPKFCAVAVNDIKTGQSGCKPAWQEYPTIISSV